LLALLEVEFVEAERCAAGEVADSLLEAVVGGELLALGDELVALSGEGVVTEVNLSCSSLHLVELEQAGLVEVGESSSFGPVVFDLAGESVEFGAEQRVIG
jgi:hypothetical protein